MVVLQDNNSYGQHLQIEELKENIVDSPYGLG